MTIHTTTPLFGDDELSSPAGHPERFGTRWRLVGAGLSNVWRYGDLVLEAQSGRLLLRGPNGTGKTTVLEALWPYLLDLNAQRLPAGKARTTTLGSLMREGASGKRRFGYAWLTFAGPGSDGLHTYGVRMQFSEGASPQVQVFPFTAPGRPIDDLPLHGPNRAPLMIEQFTEAVGAAGGQVFPDADAYVAHLAARLWNCGAGQPRELATRIRTVRNPSLLGDLSPRAAADALRESLPGIADDIVVATADALAESDATRAAFDRDRAAADTLADFAAIWSGHVVDVVGNTHHRSAEAATAVAAAVNHKAAVERNLEKANEDAQAAQTAEELILADLQDIDVRIDVLKHSDDYKAAGKLTELANQLSTECKHATATFGLVDSAATDVRARTRSLTDQLDELATELGEQVDDAAAQDRNAALGYPLLNWSLKPRAVFAIGDNTVDAGPTLTLDAKPTSLADAGQRWTTLARQHSARAGDAQLAISDFDRTVQPADESAKLARDLAGRAGAAADSATQLLGRAEASARSAALSLLDDIAAWPLDAVTPSAELIDGATDDATKPGPLWMESDVDELRAAEPGQVLDATVLWSRQVGEWSARLIAELQQQGRQHDARATDLALAAATKRMEAAELRRGRLLPLPHPAWLVECDDSAALAVALDWSPDLADPHARALIEAALAASGLLSATLSADGAVSSAWQVRSHGPLFETSLADVLTVDPLHRLATVAADVLRRVALRSSAADIPGDDGPPLVIGRDGTFRAGPLFGRAPGVDEPELLPPAEHIGAAQRRAAALARADQLDTEAAELEREAETARASANKLRERATAMHRHVGTFPTTQRLQQREAERVVAAKEAARLRAEADDAQSRSLDAAGHAAGQRQEWSERTRARSLPVDPAALQTVHDSSTKAFEVLNTAATTVAGRLRTRLDRLLTEVGELDHTVERLPQLRGDAQMAHNTAATTERTIEELQARTGSSARRAVEDLRLATAERDRLRAEVEPARKKAGDTRDEVTRLTERLATAQRNEESARPVAANCRGELRVLLSAPGVVDVLLPETSVDTIADDDLLDVVGTALTGRKTYGRKTLRDRYDTARAALAGAWTLDPADSYGELDTYVLSHDNVPFTPVTAAQRGQDLKERAQAALDAAEEAALRDFVIGRLPSAIGTAWTRLHDWVHDVNRKMRTASASSGVGVQVRARLAPDLSPAVHTVYELACRVSDADRTQEQKATIGRVIQQLITAANSESMKDKLASAVDIREWVDVHYEVTRPGKEPQRWSSKTGLSGGERRLVVLAPMLAAVAAAYDGLGPSGLRLTALDEVPAEVDERGREGLARYLAELDLDLVCTSYLWDGAPGAWDGVDAYDLEAAEDGTVVGLPMLVRGLVDLPDDPTEPTP